MTAQAKSSYGGKRPEIVTRALRPFAGLRIPDGMVARPPEGFRVARKIEVRFSDTDMMGHVNNCAYVAFFEALRFHYLSQLDFSDYLTLARLEIDFRSPVQYGETLLGAVRATRLGKSSFDLHHVLHGQDQRLVAEGTATLVALNEDGQAVPLGDALRSALTDLDGVT